MGAVSEVLGSPPGSNRQADVGVGRIAAESRTPSVNHRSAPTLSIAIPVVPATCLEKLTTSIPGQRKTRTATLPPSGFAVARVPTTRKPPAGDQATLSTVSPQKERQPSPRDPAPRIRPPASVASQMATGSA